MYKTIQIICLAVILISLSPYARAQKPNKSKAEWLVTLTTPEGQMTLRLYDQTPLHKANFLKLVKEGFYEDLLFHRVIEGFMIQGGAADSRGAAAGEKIGSTDAGYTVPAEFHPDIFHKKGVLAAARDNNPEKASSSSQFYLVQGKKHSPEDLAATSQKTGAKYTDAQIEIYGSLGGTPHLDQGYTVFGEVISGLDVIDKIAGVKVDTNNRPLEDVPMQMKLVKMKKKKVTKTYGYTFQ